MERGGEASRWGLRFRDMNKIQEISPHSGLLHEIHVYITISKASLFIFYCLNDKAPPTERDSLYHCHFHHSMSPYTYPFQLSPALAFNRATAILHETSSLPLLYYYAGFTYNRQNTHHRTRSPVPLKKTYMHSPAQLTATPHTQHNPFRRSAFAAVAVDIEYKSYGIICMPGLRLWEVGSATHGCRT